MIGPIPSFRIKHPYFQYVLCRLDNIFDFLCQSKKERDLTSQEMRLIATALHDGEI